MVEYRIEFHIRSRKLRHINCSLELGDTVKDEIYWFPISCPSSDISHDLLIIINYVTRKHTAFIDIIYSALQMYVDEF
jgi:hypothetical protein